MLICLILNVFCRDHKKNEADEDDIDWGSLKPGKVKVTVKGLGQYNYSHWEFNIPKKGQGQLVGVKFCWISICQIGYCHLQPSV